MKQSTANPDEQAARRGAGRPRRTPDQPQTRDQVLDAAERFLESHGYVATTMNDVARAVGISKPALYHYFPTKGALFLGVAERMIERDAAGMSAVTASEAGAVRQLEALAVWMFATGRHTQRMLRDAVRFLDPEHAEKLAQHFVGRMYTQVERVMQQGLEAGDLKPHDTSLSAWAFLGLVSEFAENQEGLARPTLAVDLVRLLVGGIGPR